MEVNVQIELLQSLLHQERQATVALKEELAKEKEKTALMAKQNEQYRKLREMLQQMMKG